MNLVLEDVVVPIHAVGHHHEGRAVLHQVTRHQSVLGETAWTVSFAIARREFVHIKKLSARGHSLQAFEGCVLAAGHGTVVVALELSREEPPQTLASFFVMLRYCLRCLVQELS